MGFSSFCLSIPENLVGLNGANLVGSRTKEGGDAPDLRQFLGEEGCWKSSI